MRSYILLTFILINGFVSAQCFSIYVESGSGSFSTGDKISICNSHISIFGNSYRINRQVNDKYFFYHNTGFLCSIEFGGRMFIFNVPGMSKEYISYITEKEMQIQRNREERGRKEEEKRINIIKSSLATKHKIMKDYLKKNDTSKVSELFDQIIEEEEKGMFDELYPEINKNINNFKENERIRKERAEELRRIEHERMVEKTIILNLNLGDSLFAIKNFDAAYDAYEEVLNLNPDKMRAIERIDEITKIKDILYKRRTLTFSYKENKPVEYDLFKTNLIKQINTTVENSKEGKINFQYTISYDTIGNNQSSYSIDTSSIEKFNNYLDSFKRTEILIPSKLGDYFVSSSEILKIDLSWTTAKIIYWSNPKGIKSNYQTNTEQKDYFKIFIEGQKYSYGKYTFDLKSKTINNKNFSDISLVKYESNARPYSFVYSMLMPGLGTLRVTHGERGWGRFFCFIASAGISFSTMAAANAEYKNYLSATTQSSIDQHYNAANNYHKIALVTGGIAASIYIYDITWVIREGIRNLRKTKEIRQKLKTAPIEILHQSIILQ